MDAYQQRRSKVNGKYLRHHTGKNITILGEVKKVNRNSSTLEMKSTDDCLINVIMNEAFIGDVAHDDWIEVRGVAQGRNNVLADDIFTFPKEMLSDFSPQLYDDMITVINTFNNPWVNSD